MEFLEVLGTIAFSVSGAVEAMKKQMDLLGVLVLGLVTAVGGGVLRDIVTGQVPPAAFQNPRCAAIALVTALVSFGVGMILTKRHNTGKWQMWNVVLFLSDTVGLAAFTILGIRSLQENTGSDNTVLLLFVGVITGVGGGMLRDIFAGNVPYIFRKHIYATASIVGAVLYLWLETVIRPQSAVVVSMLAIVAVRLLAAHYKWNLPKVVIRE